MNLLNKKIKHNRLRPKTSMKNKKTITKDDKAYLQWLQTQSYSCFVCGAYQSIEYHHIKEHSIDKKNHKRLIPLCVMHHRLNNELSAHGTPKKFKKIYPMEVQEKYADSIYRRYLEECEG